MVNEQIRSWGVEIFRIRVKQTEIPISMREAMVRESETERVRVAVIMEAEGRRQATLIQAEGEDQAADRLLRAARTIVEEPSGLQLRYLQAMQDMTSGKSTTPR